MNNQTYEQELEELEKRHNQFEFHLKLLEEVMLKQEFSLNLRDKIIETLWNYYKLDELKDLKNRIEEKGCKKEFDYFRIKRDLINRPLVTCGHKIAGSLKLCLKCQETIIKINKLLGIQP